MALCRLRQAVFVTIEAVILYIDVCELMVHASKDVWLLMCEKC